MDKGVSDMLNSMQVEKVDISAQADTDFEEIKYRLTLDKNAELLFIKSS